MEGDGDSGRVARFVDTIVAIDLTAETALLAEQLYWSLEPSDHEEQADFRVGVSGRVDRALVHLSADGSRITWVTPSMLEDLGMSETDAEARAFGNLARALEEATVESQDIDGVQFGFLETSLPFKASLLLAPNLQQIVGEKVGWPLMAVAPNRDFLYLWASQHTDLVGRLGDVVVREFSEAAYPLSTEVYEITASGVEAVGEFPTED